MGYVRVRSAVMMKDGYVKERLPNGKFIPTEEMTDKLTDETPSFREPIITFINDLVANDWAVYFTPFTDISYDVRIYCENPVDYENIVMVIKEKLKHKTFKDFIPSGKVSDIDSQW